ncbi:NIPSNAP family protein [Neobacillus terrae]|uniref:NIPSNAP family protein n=1 Tax=Neobacillus terrae TaxID=3034837 RepID=UPI00140B5B19|nr:NIPSNAP family protein [Neobacillus terrae]NHM32267.1 cytoplasmic protein [Neobacillus terrae]
MFYRRKSYIVKSHFVENFNEHFNKTNLPNQLKQGSRMVGRWMKDNQDHTFEIFAIWEYDSYEHYIEIEKNIKNDTAHIQRIKDWYEKNGGREHVFKEYILEVKNEEVRSTLY